MVTRVGNSNLVAGTYKDYVELWDDNVDEFVLTINVRYAN